MSSNSFLDRLPTEILCYVCESLPLNDLDALERGHIGRLREVVHDYILFRALKSIKYPLHESVRIGRVDLIKHLATDAAVNVNARDAHGRAPLHVAAATGAVSAAKALLQFPAINKETQDRHFRTPLFVAMSNRRLAMAEFLLSEGVVHRKALSLAVKIGDVSLVRLLVGMDRVDVNETEESNKSPLLIAAKNGRSDITQELLSHKDINTELRHRRTLRTPFLVAASLDHMPVLQQLIGREDTNVHASDGEQRTALSLAAEQGHLCTVKMLLELGISPHRADRFGRTCLHYAVQRKHEQVVALLLRQRCDCQLRDDKGMSPLRLAIKARHDGIAEMMLTATAFVDYRDLLIAATEYSNIAIAKLALDHISPNLRYNGATALLHSTRPTFFHFLLRDDRIDPNQCDWSGTTPLIYAVRNNWISVIPALLAMDDLDVDIVDDDELTASDYARNLGLRRIEKLLRDHRKTKAREKYRATHV